MCERLWDEFAISVTADDRSASDFERLLTELGDSQSGSAPSLRVALLIELARLEQADPLQALALARELADASGDAVHRFRYLYGAFMLNEHELVLQEDVVSLSDELHERRLYDDELYAITYRLSSLVTFDRFAEALELANELHRHLARIESQVDYAIDVRYTTSPLIYQLERKAIEDPVWAALPDLLRRDLDHGYWEVI